jgi:hypothetical protein
MAHGSTHAAAMQAEHHAEHHALCLHARMHQPCTSQACKVRREHTHCTVLHTWQVLRACAPCACMHVTYPRGACARRVRSDHVGQNPEARQRLGREVVRHAGEGVHGGRVSRGSMRTAGRSSRGAAGRPPATLCQRATARASVSTCMRAGWRGATSCARGQHNTRTNAVCAAPLPARPPPCAPVLSNAKATHPLHVH